MNSETIKIYDLVSLMKNKEEYILPTRTINTGKLALAKHFKGYIYGMNEQKNCIKVWQHDEDSQEPIKIFKLKEKIKDVLVESQYLYILTESYKIQLIDQSNFRKIDSDLVMSIKIPESLNFNCLTIDKGKGYFGGEKLIGWTLTKPCTDINSVFQCNTTAGNLLNFFDPKYSKEQKKDFANYFMWNIKNSRDQVWIKHFPLLEIFSLDCNIEGLQSSFEILDVLKMDFFQNMWNLIKDIDEKTEEMEKNLKKSIDTHDQEEIEFFEFLRGILIPTKNDNISNLKLLKKNIKKSAEIVIDQIYNNYDQISKKELFMESYHTLKKFNEEFPTFPNLITKLFIQKKATIHLPLYKTHGKKSIIEPKITEWVKVHKDYEIYKKKDAGPYPYSLNVTRSNLRLKDGSKDSLGFFTMVEELPEKQLEKFKPIIDKKWESIKLVSQIQAIMLFISAGALSYAIYAQNSVKTATKIIGAIAIFQNFILLFSSIRVVVVGPVSLKSKLFHIVIYMIAIVGETLKFLAVIKSTFKFFYWVQGITVFIIFYDGFVHLRAFKSLRLPITAFIRTLK